MDKDKNEVAEVTDVKTTTAACADAGAFIGGVAGAIIGGAFGLATSIFKIFTDED